MNDISPVRQGQTDPPFHWQFKNSSGSPISFASGTSFVCLFFNPQTNISTQGTGTVNIVDLTNGYVDYVCSAGDTAVAGDYQVYMQYTLPSGAVGYCLPVDLEVLPIYTQPVN
jgi:hypothetical protein